MWFNRLMSVATVAVFSSAIQAEAIRYVDDDALEGGDGLTWCTAYQFLQDALAEASNPDNGVCEIRVAQGTYKPDQDEAGNAAPGDQGATFQLISAVAVIGGFGGLTAPTPDGRDIAAFETILSGDLLGDDGPGFANNAENSHHVVTGSGTDATAALDGFTIAAGNANGTADELWGGGMYNAGGSPTVVDCTFRDNSAGSGCDSPCSAGGGAGMYNNDSNPTVIRCTFTGNCALHTCFEPEEGYFFECGAGGGMYNVTSNPSVMNCTFTQNTAGSGGGIYSTSGSPTVTDCTFSANGAATGAGMSVSGGSPAVTNCTFSQNAAEYAGGGMNISSGSPVVTNCTFTMNDASEGGGMHNRGSLTSSNCTFNSNTAQSGGGMHSSASNPLVTKCAFLGNDAFTFGGGLFIRDTTTPITNCVFSQNISGKGGGLYSIYNDFVLVNCRFNDNVATNDTNAALPGRGGGVYTASANLAVVNCLFFENAAETIGGGLLHHATAQEVYVKNCISWGNTPNHLYSDIGGALFAYYSDVEGGWSGLGSNNIDADPMFVDAAGGDLRLLPGSPCIDAGDNTAVPMDITTDLDGNPRFVDDPNTKDTGNPDGINPIVDMGAYEFQLHCPWDLDGSGDVGITDLLALLGAWGTNPGGPPDFDGDMNVGVTDLLTLLGNWGQCP